MLQPTWRHIAGVLTLFVVAAGEALVPGTAVAADRVADQNLSVEHLRGDAARMYGFVKTPHPGELKWQQIPWLTDLPEALRQARAERRPLVLFVSGDDPLEKC
jgi:hypothetical protein